MQVRFLPRAPEINATALLVDMHADPKWWNEAYGFFGTFYMQGDDSKEGYRIAEKQNLRERTITEVDGILRLLALQPASKILDCPCGYGRHSIELAKRAFDVTGSDLNATHLSAAKKEAATHGVNIHFVQENMLDLRYASEFDAIVNMFYSFGFFESDADNFRVLKNFFRALKPSGKFLMQTDVNIPFIEAGKYKHDEERKLTNGGTLRIIDRYDPSTKRINGEWIVKDHRGNESGKAYSVRVYTKDEFIDLCTEAGFTSCAAYSDWDATPYSTNSEDMMIVATK